MQISYIDEDKPLLSKVANGDEQAFKRLFDLYRPNVYTTALRITGDERTAEEILQDTFLKVWINRERIVHIGNFGGWIYTIAKNATYNAIKRSQSEKRNFLQFIREPIITYCQDTDHLTREREYQNILNLAITRLPPKQLLTYKLIKQQEMKREEAAIALNVSAETVKWNLDQAMRSIRAFCMAHLKETTFAFILYFIFY